MSHDLSGVRLGRVERALLLQAPPPFVHAGLVIVAPDRRRATQEALLRALGKLERVGLVDAYKLGRTLRAEDPRRARPVLCGRRFLRTPDGCRIHRTKTFVIWASPFGEAICTTFKLELQEGLRIRWDPKKIAAAHRYADAHRVDPYARSTDRSVIEQRMEEQHDVEEAKPREAFPLDPMDPGQIPRWHRCIAEAKKATRSRNSERVWKASTELFLQGQPDAQTSRGKRSRPGGLRPPLMLPPLPTYRLKSDDPTQS